MRTFTVLVSALSFVGVNSLCLLPNDATTLANNFGKLISQYSNELANQTLTPDFVDYSESVNTLIDSGTYAPQALLGQTFSSRAAFETGSAAQPSVPFTVKNIWHNCDVITVRWESDQTGYPVVGISVLHTTFTGNFKHPSLWQIDEIWAEFDSGAWLHNLGCTISNCPAPPSKKREVAFEA